MMSAQNVTVSAVEIGEDWTPAVHLSADVPDMGASPIGRVDVDGADRVLAVVVHAAADVSSLDPATVGAAVIAALESV